MAGLKVAVVGAGELGRLVATRIPPGPRKVIISHYKSEAVALADEVGGLATDQESAVRGCQIIFLAASGQVMNQVVQGIVPYVDNGALCVNMATDMATPELASAFDGLRFAAAKVVGHPRDLAVGSAGLIMLDHVMPSDEELLRSLLQGLGTVMRAPESTALLVNSACIRAMAQAEVALRTELVGLGLPEDQARTAVTATGPGILRSICTGEITPFVRSILADLPKEERIEVPSQE